MSIEMLRISLDILSGEEVNQEDRERLRNHKIRYELVRYLYQEKMKMLEEKTNKKLMQFHFTPGPEFEKTPIVDVVNSLVEIFEKTKIGEYQPVITGMRKTKLEDWKPDE